MNLPVNQIICGDCIEVMKTLPADSVDTVITDPPYELGFMGKSWDKSGIAFNSETWREVLRIAKPGAIMLCFGGSRTFHRIACAIEDAGWQIRDTIMWLYGSGFPKSLDISKAIDKAAGQKTVIGKSTNQVGVGWAGNNQAGYKPEFDITIPATAAAAAWSGWGTALKPAFEPIIVAMKPLDGTFIENALKHGVAGLNIDGARIGFVSDTDKKSAIFGRGTDILGGNYVGGTHGTGQTNIPPNDKGRWPANVIFDSEAAALLDEQSGESKSSQTQRGDVEIFKKEKSWIGGSTERGHNDSGGASRFFYTAKAHKAERNVGCGEMEAKENNSYGEFNGTPGHSPKLNVKKHNFHPTVKPLDLMEYLCRLTKTPTGGIVLDPFSGSGTTALQVHRNGTSRFVNRR